VVSLDVPLPSDNGATVKDLIPSKELLVDEQVEIQELKDMIQGLIDEHLDEREAFVVRQHFGMNHKQTEVSLREIGRQINRSNQRVGQIKDAALDKLKGPIAELRAGAEVSDV
jgi:RNA polymerase primary sigma factor